MNSSKKEEQSSLGKVLRQRLDKIDGARMMHLSTLDGIELLNVSLESEGARQSEEAQLMAPYIPIAAATADQVSKLGLGQQQYSLTWIDSAILVQVKLEAAVLSIYLEDSANLGLLDDQVALLKKILAPFTSANFITATL
eukprot:gene25696-31031_t